MASQRSNHSDLPSSEELLELKKQTNLEQNTDDFPQFKKNSKEDLFLNKRRELLFKQMQQQKKLKEQNVKLFQKIVDDLPVELGIPLKMMNYPHTQWMLGQWISKLNRIATSSLKDLKDSEKPFHKISKMMVALSPDVGTSTNLSFSMDQKVYHPVRSKQTELKWQIENKKSPDLNPDTSVKNRFFRFEIAEGTATSCLGAFGKSQDLLGIPIVPVMTVYDFFIKRALDQYFYSLYWSSNFILAGTPSGVTLSPEGAQHGWKSDIQIPNQVCFEPYFCKEVDWILTDAIYRQCTQNNQQRSGVLIRAVTRGVNQKDFLRFLKSQARFKKEKIEKALHPKGFPIQNAIDESVIQTVSEKEIEGVVREEVLKGAYPLIHYKGYQDYKEGENVVNIFAMGALGTEACQASMKLLEKGIYANVIIVTSPDLLLGSLAHQNQYQHLNTGLDVGVGIPIVSVHDGEPGLLDNLGSILGQYQEVLAVRKHSMCGRPSDIYTYHGINVDDIVSASLNTLHSH